MIQAFTLKNGVRMPALGLGTWQLEGERCVAAVKKALELGYTHIDTAEFYGNHRAIGKAIAGHDRKKLFITSKVPPPHLRHDDVIASCDAALEELGTPYLDLFLIHWPNKATPMAETFRALKELHDEGKVRAVGVSNFTIRHLQEALPIAKEMGLDLCVNQVEFHPGLYQKELLEFCTKHGIRLTAYSPLGRGSLMRDEDVLAIAERHAKTAAQICLRWAYEKGCVAIPKAGSAEHLFENMDIFDFELAKEDVEALDAMPKERIIRPPFAEFDD